MVSSMARTTDAIPNALEVRPLCLIAVSGLVCVVNDILFRPALPRVLTDPNFQPKTLVFFGGDVQNFFSAMDTGDAKINNHHWCLETAAIRLGSNFPQHHIVVVRPSRTLCDHVNCFDNFVHSNYVGAPTHVYQYKGLEHLERMLYKMSKRIRRTDSDELFSLLLKKQEDEQDCESDDPTGTITWQYEGMPQKRKEALIRWQKSLHLDRYPVTLAAFSKGCVVLNQFLYEFHFARGLEPKMQDSSFIDRIEHMYWLDGGHPGRNTVYPTSIGLLRTVSELGIQLHVHLSQYQMEDYLRPWIRQQCHEFLDTLRSFNAKLVVYHHVSEFTDLRAHWSVFLNFMQHESAPPRPAPLPLAGGAGGAAGAAPAPALPPAPHGPRAPPHTPRERAMMHREILGLALVSHNDKPDLALQLIFRRPLEEIISCYRDGPRPETEASQASAGSSAPDSSQPSTSRASNSGETRDSQPSTSRASNSGETRDSQPSTSRASNSGETRDSQPSTSRASNSGETRDSQPSTSRASNSGKTRDSQPSTSRASNSGETCDSQPSTSRAPNSGETRDSQSSTSIARSSETRDSQPSTSSAPPLSNSENPDPGEGPSSAPEASTSASSSPSTSTAPKRRLADGFEVLAKKRSTRIDFSRDPEALEAYETARYYELEMPVIATLAEEPKPKDSIYTLNIYSPVKNHYTPIVLNQRQLVVDSRTAATPVGGRPQGPGPSASEGTSRGQSAAPQPSTSRGNHRNTRTSNPRTVTQRRNDPVPSSSSSSEMETSDTEVPARVARRSVRTRRAPYPRRGTNRYNLRSSR